MQSQAATAAPIETLPIQPASTPDEAGVRPTEIRFGWCPFGDIDLRNGNVYSQPPSIDIGGQVVPNPYHTLLPAKQLIPFPTFPYTIQKPSTTQTDSNGKALLETSTDTMPALHAAVGILRQYSGWGFVILQSLQGMDQDQAIRIFLVVMPLAYRLVDLPTELTMGADERIESLEPITFPNLPDYVVQPLRSDFERSTARRLASEMLAGAEIAISLANEILDKTESSMIKAASSGQGKSGPDSLDRRLALELGRTLPQYLAKANPTAEINQRSAEMDKKLDLLVDHTVQQRIKEENAALRAENEALRAGKTVTVATPVTVDPETETITVPPTSVPSTQPQICGVIKDNGEPCRTPTKGGPCANHKDR